MRRCAGKRGRLASALAASHPRVKNERATAPPRRASGSCASKHKWGSTALPLPPDSPRLALSHAFPRNLRLHLLRLLQVGFQRRQLALRKLFQRRLLRGGCCALEFGYILL